MAPQLHQNRVHHAESTNFSTPAAQQMSQNEAHIFSVSLSLFFFQSDQSVRAVNYFWLHQYLLVCISDSFFSFFLFTRQWFFSFPAEKIRSEWITGELMWACHSSSHDGSLKAGWRDVLRFLYPPSPSPVQTSHHDRPSQAPFHSNRTCSGMII